LSIETCKSYFKKRKGKRKNNGRDEPNWGIYHSEMKTPYNYYILIKKITNVAYCLLA
jgi:hypothetical protein